MESETNECIELLDILDMVNFCEDIQECESDMEFDDYFDVESPNNDILMETDVETDSDFDESDVDDVDISDDDNDNMDILQCFINIIELDCILNLSCDDKQLKRRIKRWGVHPINQLRKELGHFDNLMNEMLMNDHDKFFNYTRMSPKMFEDLLNLVSSKITKSAPNAIPAKFRLLLTLRFKYF